MARAGPLFLSYSSHDRETAREVEAVLTAAPIGKRVWRDERSIERDWSREIAGALAESEAIVSVWSANAAESHWVRHEWLTARALGKPIMPVLTDGTPLPPPLENLQAVVTTGGHLDAAAAARRLSAVLAARPAYDFTIRPRGLQIPLPPNPNFVGREDDLLDLYLALIGQFNRIGTRAVGAVGMGGVGKTQLAVEFVHRFAFAFAGIHWINAAHEDEWTARFVSLARDDLRLRPDGEAEPSDQEWIRLLHAHCAEHPELLLVMDNVADPERLAAPSLLGVTPLDLGCSLLFTTRRRFELPGVASHTVGILGERAAYELLTTRRSPDNDAETEHAHAICAALGFLPLALVLAAAYLARYGDVGFGDYRRALAENRLDTVDVQRLSAAKLATRHEAAVRLTLENQSQALTDPAARLLFRLAGLMREGELIPAGRLGLLAGLHQEPGALARPLDDARLELEDLSLAEPAEGGRALRLHPLVHDFARGLVADPAAERAAAAERLAEAYADAEVLEREYAQRGPDGLIGDVALALDWRPAGAADGSLPALAEILDAESAALNRFPHARYPALFLQQLANRAALIGAGGLAESARTRLRATGRAHFVHRWRTQGSSPELMRTIVGSQSWVTTAAISPSARLLVTAAQHASSESGTVIGVWDLATGRHIEDIDPQEQITALLFPGEDDDHVLTTGSSGELRLWHLPTGQVARAAAGGGDKLAALTLTPDRRTALTSGDQDTLLAWDLTRWSAPRVVGTTGNGADAIAATPDGAHALVASYGAPPGGTLLDDRGWLELWRLETGERLREVEAHSFFIDVVLVAGDSVLTAGRDGWLRRWALDGLEPEGGLQVRDPSAAAMLPDGRVAIASGREVAIVDLAELSVVRTLRGHSGVLFSIDVSPDGTRLVSAAADGTARVWRLDREASGGRRQPGHGASVQTGLALEHVAVTGDRDGVLKLWARETGELLAEHKQWMGQRDNAVAARGGRIVLTSSADLEGGSIFALDVDERTERNVMSTDGRVPFLRFDRGEQILVVGDRSALRVYDSAAIDDLLGTLRTALKPPPGDDSFDAAAMTSDGTLLAAATSYVFGGDDTLVLFDVASGEILGKTDRVAGNVGHMAISEDGTRVAFTTGSGLFGVWEPFGGGPPRILARALGRAPRVLDLGDGRLVTAADEICVWAAGRDEPVRRLGGHPGTWHLELAGPDRVLTASDDWTVSLWDLEAGAEIAMLALDGSASIATLSADARAFLCGDDGGDVYVFELLLPGAT